LFEVVIVDGVDVVVLRRPAEGRMFRESVADSRHGRGDFACYLFVDGDQLGGALADVRGEGVRLGLPGCALRGRTPGRAVADRHVLAHVESRRLGVFDRVADSGAGRIQI
jgi:hypothetical protein